MYIAMSRFKSVTQGWQVAPLGLGTDDLETAQKTCDETAKQMKQGMCWVMEFDVPPYRPNLLKLVEVNGSADNGNSEGQ